MAERFFISLFHPLGDIRAALSLGFSQGSGPSRQQADAGFPEVDRTRHSLHSRHPGSWSLTRFVFPIPSRSPRSIVLFRNTLRQRTLHGAESSPSFSRKVSEVSPGSRGPGQVTAGREFSPPHQSGSQRQVIAWRDSGRSSKEERSFWRN